MKPSFEKIQLGLIRDQNQILFIRDSQLAEKKNIPVFLDTAKIFRNGFVGQTATERKSRETDTSVDP